MARQPRFASLRFPPIRQRFATKHELEPSDSIDAILDYLADFAHGKVDPRRLTLVTTGTIAEFLGVSIPTLNYWRTDPPSLPYGPMPLPRDPGGPVRTRGVQDLWLLEVDIIPWLLGTEAGVNLLHNVIGDIVKYGRTVPVLNGSRVVDYVRETDHVPHRDPAAIDG